LLNRKLEKDIIKSLATDGEHIPTSVLVSHIKTSLELTEPQLAKNMRNKDALRQALNR
jgi:hypothetical protein